MKPFSYGPSTDFLIDNNITYEASDDPFRCSDQVHVGVFNQINIDPLLVDPASGDFKLQTGSPAIGAGVDNIHEPSVPTDDIIGNPRTPNTDSGAYQYIPSGAAPHEDINIVMIY
jgi:hypothetical protein